LKKNTKVSALAITLNEASTIKKLIEGVSFADEIIIVDSYSTDDTVAIANEYDNVKVIQREFNNFSDQKNFAISKASNDWIVFFDPDEEITKELVQEIKNTLQNPKSIAYYVKRRLYFMNKKIKYSGFQTDQVIRLFNKNYCKYNGQFVHETLSVNGKTAMLKACLPHHTYRSFEEYKQKLNNYNSLQAKMLFNKGKKATFFHLVFRPTYRFWNQYFMRRGILDGWEGFILAYINAHSVFNRYVKLRLLHKGMK